MSAFAATDNFSHKKARLAEIPPPLEAPRVGETLVYDVFWMGIPIGEGRLELKEKTTRQGRPVYHAVATAKTNDFLSKLYPVSDQIHSFFTDGPGFYSLEFRKTLKEGRYRADERIVFDVSKKKAFYESFHNGSQKELNLSGETHDLLGAFYWFRFQRAEVGKSARTVVNDEEESWDLEMAVLRRERKELRGQGAFDTIVVEPKTRLRGALHARGRAWIWFTADERRIPVFIRLQTPYGPVVGALKNIQE